MKRYKRSEKYKKMNIVSWGLLCCFLLLLSGCGLFQSPKEEEKGDIGFVAPGPNSFDSADTAVLVSKDEEEKTVTLLNLDLGRTYTLSVEGTTTIFDKYGEGLSFGQIQPGEIVDVTFLKKKKRLNSMQISAQAWSKDNISKYEIDSLRKTISVGNEVFQMNGNTQFLSLGENVELMDLNPVDQLTIKGIGTTVLSVLVTQGHGYLRLQNDTQFLGGFIEIGDSIIHVITEDMLLTVPEGGYQVVISHRLGGGKKNISIQRGKEFTLDIGDLQVEAPKMGMVVFSMTPSTATLYVDGQKVDTSMPVSLTYGIHQIIARASGYKTLTSYIKVASASGGIDVTLDPEKEAEPDKTEGHKVYIDAPEEAEVFLDGNYVGVVPTSFKKEAGSHSITLRRSGYETRSYTINIDNSNMDVNYSFAELTPVSEISPSPRPSASPDGSPSASPSASPSTSPDVSPSASPSSSPSVSPSSSPSVSPSSSPSASPSSSPSVSPSSSPSVSPSSSPSVSPSSSPSVSPSANPSTSPDVSPSATPSVSPSASPSSSPSVSPSASPVANPSSSPTS